MQLAEFNQKLRGSRGAIIVETMQTFKQIRQGVQNDHKHLLVTSNVMIVEGQMASAAAVSDIRRALSKR